MTEALFVNYFMILHFRGHLVGTIHTWAKEPEEKHLWPHGPFLFIKCLQMPPPKSWHFEAQCRETQIAS